MAERCPLADAAERLIAGGAAGVVFTVDAGYRYYQHEVQRDVVLLEMAQMRPTFYADDSRMEAKSIVWMQQRIPPRVCALHPLLKPAAAVFRQRPVSTVSGRWGAFFKDGLVTHVVNRASGIDLVCVQFPGKGSLVVERCGDAEYFFLSLPVLISEENFDSSPTLR
eukprot:3229847-Rhodomonas_salina.1